MINAKFIGRLCHVGRQEAVELCHPESMQLVSVKVRIYNETKGNYLPQSTVAHSLAGPRGWGRERRDLATMTRVGCENVNERERESLYARVIDSS